MALAADEACPSCALRVYVGLSSYQGTNEECWPSIDQIRDRLNLGPTSVKKGTKWLLDQGWIERRRGAPGKSNVYRVLMDADADGHGGCPSKKSLMDTGGVPQMDTGGVHPSTVVTTNKTPKEETATETPTLRTLTNLYCELHKTATGAKPAFTKADGIMFAGLLKQQGYDTVAAKLHAYYERPQWFTKAGSFSAKGFRSHYDDINILNGNGKGRPVKLTASEGEYAKEIADLFHPA